MQPPPSIKREDIVATLQKYDRERDKILADAVAQTRTNSERGEVVVGDGLSDGEAAHLAWLELVRTLKRVSENTSKNS